MTILNILIVFVVIGLALWIINTYIPMEGKIKRLMNIAVIIVLVLWLLQGFGLLNALNTPVLK